MKELKGAWGKIFPMLFPKAETVKVMLRDPDAMLNEFLHSGRGNSPAHKAGRHRGPAEFEEF